MRIYLFGDLRVFRSAEERSDIRLTHALQALLAFLLIHRHHLHVRETLIELFWADHDVERARSCLNTALWRLRRALESGGVAPGTYLTASSEGKVGFNDHSDYWLDIEEFECQSHTALAKPVTALSQDDVAYLQGALQLYTRDLLEGFYDDWVLRERERLRLMYLNGLAHLMHYYKEQRVFETSAHYAQQILGLDPLREEVHRELMTLYVDSQQRTLALQQYEKCRAVLAEELGVTPMAETQALYQRIKTDPADAPGSTTAAGDLPPDVQRQLLSTLQATAQAALLMQRATQYLESILTKL